MDETETIAISALQHFSFCPRQCGLIHLEQSFDDNALTIRGHAAHSRVDREETRTSADTRIEYGLAVYSDTLKIRGKADLVEFLPDGTPYPVEYKHGRRASKLHDQIQLAAQAMCLQEMTGIAVKAGAIYYFSSRKRLEVKITEELRSIVRETIHATRAMLMSQKLPPPVDDDRCRNCSLIDLCQPKAVLLTKRRHTLLKELFSINEQ